MNNGQNAGDLGPKTGLETLEGRLFEGVLLLLRQQLQARPWRQGAGAPQNAEAPQLAPEEEAKEDL